MNKEYTFKLKFNVNPILSHQVTNLVDLIVSMMRSTISKFGADRIFIEVKDESI